MRLVLYFCSVMFVVLCAVWAYRVNYRTQDALHRVADLRSQITREHETLEMLQTEWAYLNRPDRLHRLVQDNAEWLELLPLQPEHFGEVAMVAYPPVEPIDVSDLIDAVAGEYE